MNSTMVGSNERSAHFDQVREQLRTQEAIGRKMTIKEEQKSCTQLEERKKKKR